MAGKIREGKIIAGKKYDLILMDMLTSEFKSSKINDYLNNDNIFYKIKRNCNLAVSLFIFNIY